MRASAQTAAHLVQLLQGELHLQLLTLWDNSQTSSICSEDIAYKGGCRCVCVSVWGCRCMCVVQVQSENRAQFSRCCIDDSGLRFFWGAMQHSVSCDELTHASTTHTQA